MSGLLVLASALGLEALPTAMARSRVELAPSGLARTAVLASAMSLFLIEAAAVLCAIPLVAGLMGRTTAPHLFPGGTVAGVASAVLAVWLPIRVTRMSIRVRRQRRKLRPEAWLGTHVAFDGFELVVIPTWEKLAFAVPGSTPQVVISRGALRGLDSDQLMSIVRHERAHLEHHHTAYLAVASLLSPMARVPVVGDSIRNLPVWLERWADDEAAVTPAERRRVRDLLESLTVTDYGAAAASMVPAGTLPQRLEALDEAPARSSRVGAVIVVLALAITGAIGFLPILARLL